MNKNNLIQSKNKILYLTALVGGFALLASALLSLGDMITKDAIAQRRVEDLKSSLEQVIPPDIHDNDLLADTLRVSHQELTEDELKVYRARRGNNVQAVAYETSVPGYAGPIVVVMGVDRNGVILGARVISHAETPGLGDRIETNKSDWILGFNGHSLENPKPEDWAVKKDGGIFDQFTGATITPRRTIYALRQGLEFFDKHRSLLLDEASTVLLRSSSSYQSLHFDQGHTDESLQIACRTSTSLFPGQHQLEIEWFNKTNMLSPVRTHY